MFTGLVQAVGQVLALEPIDGGVLQFAIDPCDWNYTPQLGDSVAVNGCCLTLVERPMRTLPPSPARGPRRRVWVFHVVPETLAKTTLGSLAIGSRVNLEHAARADTLLGGHIVQGHIDGVGTVTHAGSSARSGGKSGWRLRVRVPAALDQYLAPKGSIAIDGVSLTIADLWQTKTDRGLSVALIPTTLERTTLAELKPGSRVNIETDILSKTIVRVIMAQLPRIVARGKSNHEGTKARRKTKTRA